MAAWGLAQHLSAGSEQPHCAPLLFLGFYFSGFVSLFIIFIVFHLISVIKLFLFQPTGFTFFHTFLPISLGEERVSKQLHRT